MNTYNENSCAWDKHKRKNSKVLKDLVDKSNLSFSRVGGLAEHIKTLKELIFPLVHGEIYSYFKIKPPRGVLFHGPPGTGKTLLAGALAVEVKKSTSCGEVSFYHRKGADILNKYLGESERKLRELFYTAEKNTPAIIFFDELDGLAPSRREDHEHTHCSVVATLLALMDGLDAMPGVIVIGATNRLDAVDPALRRPGRFDKELYFPMPSKDARKEILEVQTKSWLHKPNKKTIEHLADITAGFSGAQLQALCREAVLVCIKRTHPGVHDCIATRNRKLKPEDIKVEAGDFNEAKDIIAKNSPLAKHSRENKLNAIIEPLLRPQLNKITDKIMNLWPHFLQPTFKYDMGNERYAGRVVIFGCKNHGLNAHLLPAVLHRFEHLSSYVIDSPNDFDISIENAKTTLPCIIVLARLDEWWDLMNKKSQMSLVFSLEEIHAGMPLLIITTCKEEVPLLLQNLFYGNNSALIHLSEPKTNERGEFFAPLYFGEKHPSLAQTLCALRTSALTKSQNCSKKETVDSKINGHQKVRSCRNVRLRGGGGSFFDNYLFRFGRAGSRRNSGSVSKNCYSHRRRGGYAEVLNKPRAYYLSKIIAEIIEETRNLVSLINPLSTKIKREPKSGTNLIALKSNNFSKSSDPEKRQIYALWSRTTTKTSKGMTVPELELLYDALVKCINLWGVNFRTLTEHLEDTLEKFECSMAENLCKM